MRADLHAVPQEDRAGDLRGFVDLDIAAREHAGEELAAERRRRQTALEEIRVRARVLGNGPDVGPVAGCDVAVERLTLGEEGREEILAEVERLAGLVALEHARLDHVDAGVDRVGEDLAPRRLLEELRDAPVLAGDHDAVLERIRDVVERERDGGLALAMERDDLREIDVRQRVARDHDEGVVEGVTDLTDGSAGAERRFLDAVLQAHADRAAIAEAVLDLRREVLQGHERVVDPVALEQIEDMPEAWLIDDRDHRLGPIDRQGAQAAPLAAGHDHGLHQSEFRARGNDQQAHPPVIPSAPLQR